jgi:hypothetical protein
MTSSNEGADRAGSRHERRPPAEIALDDATRPRAPKIAGRRRRIVAEAGTSPMCTGCISPTSSD